LVDELELLRSTRIVTGRYATWEAAHGVPVRITVGEPKFWRGPELVDARVLAPFGLLDSSIPTDECRRLYLERLCDKADRIVAVLARIATEHRGQPLCLLCFEDVSKDECHRRWFAAWWQDRFGLTVPEVPADALRPPERPQEPSPRLPGI
jgi:hypothetical protein